ncbi:MAG: type VI secretion system tube protein Hcp [Lysobacterales bacterium]
MATYIHFSNDVEGPCEKKNHEGWIEMDSWGWSCARELSGGNQVGLASGIAKFESLSFQASIGSATIAMYQKMLFGVHFDEVLIECTKNVGTEEPEPWLKIKLEHVLVVEIAQSIDSDTAADDIKLAFSQVEVSIADQKKDGTLDTEKTFTYDLTTAVG